MNIVESIRAAGVVGAGGAGFPTHVKLSGKAEIVEETDWGAWHVQKITSDYSESEMFAWMDRANYILLFDAERGYLLTVKGTSDMETLEHIARELEVRESDTPNPPSDVAETISILEPGRG